MTPEQMTELAARLRDHAEVIYGLWKDDLHVAANLIESMAQRVPMTLDFLLSAAEVRTASYADDPRENIQTDVMNAFFAGAAFAERHHGIRSEK